MDHSRENLDRLAKARKVNKFNRSMVSRTSAEFFHPTGVGNAVKLLEKDFTNGRICVSYRGL
jgi:hypothetical protein